MPSNVVMVATSTRSSRAYPHGALASVVAINARVVVRVRKLYAALLAWVLVRIADL
jgi:hypothetical protein